MNEHHILVFHEPDDTTFQPVLDGILEYGIEAVGGREPRHLGVLIQSENDEVIGGGIGHEILKVFFLNHLWVAEEHRNRGFGSALLAEIEKQASALGCKELRLETLNPRSLAFYSRHGYETYARIPEYIPGFERVFFRKATLKPSRQSPE